MLNGQFVITEGVNPPKLRMLASISFKYVLYVYIIWAVVKVLNFVEKVIQAFTLSWAFQEISWCNVACVVDCAAF